MRLSKKDAQAVKNGLVAALNTNLFIHPSHLPNQFDGIWINDAQKRAYLRRMADSGLIQARWHERGWYKWYTYRARVVGETL